MKKLRIGFDIDDVLLNSASALTTLHNKLYGTDVGLRHNYNHVDIEDWGVSNLEELNNRIHEVIAMEEWSDLAVPFENAIGILQKLKDEGCELFAVTGRPPSSRQRTLKLLERYYPGIFSDETLYMTDVFSYDGSPVKKITKLDIAKELELTHFVEDYLVHADVLGEGGIKTVLFSNGYPWNQTGGHESLIRLNSWSEIREFFEDERRA